MLKGYKYRIFPTDTQKDQLQRYFGVNRLVYNLGLETKTVAYASNKKSISKYDLIKQLPELRQEFDYIKECPSQVLSIWTQHIETFLRVRVNFLNLKISIPNSQLHFHKALRYLLKMVH